MVEVETFVDYHKATTQIEDALHVFYRENMHQPSVILLPSTLLRKFKMEIADSLRGSSIPYMDRRFRFCGILIFGVDDPEHSTIIVV